MKRRLTVSILCSEAKRFAKAESSHPEPAIYGITDGKAVGTYFEHKFQAYLSKKYTYVMGSSAKGIDFPEISVDLKVTSIKQPQSSLSSLSRHARLNLLAKRFTVSDTPSSCSCTKRPTTTEHELDS